jgi:ketosteroid isomerase-like protein
MKNTNFKSACMFVVLMLVAATAFSQADLKAKIEKLNKEMGQAMIEGNYEKSLAMYAPDGISMPSYAKMAEGIEAIKKSQMEMMKSGMKVTSFETTTLKVSSCESMVTEIGTYKMSFTMAGMEAPMSDMGKYVTIWEKQKDGSLKIKVEIWNTDMNPMEHMDHKGQM